MIDLRDKYIVCNDNNYNTIFKILVDNYKFDNSGIVLRHIELLLEENDYVIVHLYDNFLRFYTDNLNDKLPRISGDLLLRGLKIGKIKSLL